MYTHMFVNLNISPSKSQLIVCSVNSLQYLFVFLETEQYFELVLLSLDLLEGTHTNLAALQNITEPF